MTDAQTERIMDGIAEIQKDLAVHDAKTAMYVDRIVSAEERVAEAVTKVADATVEIKAAVVQLGKNGNGASRGIQLDRKTLMWLIGMALAGSAAIGGGSEVAHRVFDAVMFPSSVHQAAEKGETP